MMACPINHLFIQSTSPTKNNSAEQNIVSYSTFDNNSGAPHVLLLQKGTMYRHDSWDELLDFAVSEYEVLSRPEPIPAPPSVFDQLEAFFLLKNGNIDAIKVAGAGVAVAFVLALLMRMVVGGGGGGAAADSSKKRE